VRPRLSIIGCGRVGQTIGRALGQAGWRIMAVTCGEQEHADLAGAFVGASGTVDNAAAACLGDVILITTPDDVIASATSDLAAAGALRSDHVVLHTSGGCGLDVLGAARKAGAAVGSVHPIHSFARPEATLERLRGTIWGVTAEPLALETALTVVRDAAGVPVEVREEDRPIYHAAAVVASNALIGVLGFATTLLESVGFADGLAERALMPLAEGTVANAAEIGILEALTGPIVRGDVNTVERHLVALGAADPVWAREYRAISRLTLEVARKRATLAGESLRRMERLLADTDEDGDGR
jgi:predicted short-subunit dehydrogenase-like oxidoreductase (DUF2520 family)